MKSSKLKTSSKLTLIFLTCTAGAAFAQDNTPNCAVTNFDQSRNLFTVMNATPGAVNQQCFLTVLPATSDAGVARSNNVPYVFREGTYEIILSGGGGGGGGGSTREGGGGGGAGALPSRTVQYLPAGVYRLTLGKGGQGGPACVTAVSGGRGTDGNPTSLSEAYSGMTVAGFPRAEYWAGQAPITYTVASAGRVVPSQPSIPNAVPDGGGGDGVGGQSSGGEGGHTHRGQESRAQDGTQLAAGAWYGLPGRGGNSNNPSRSELAFAGGGGGGAGYGNGGDGQSAGVGIAAKTGDLGAGGGGGAGGRDTCGIGAAGGDGFIKVAMVEPAPVAAAPAPAAPPPQIVIVREPPPPPQMIAVAPVTSQKFSMSADTLFDFNSSVLSSAGRAKLDDMIARIGSVDIDKIIDTGHADRIGSSDYNQKLSQARAQSVKNYLVSRGLPSDRILAIGKGETEPVTSAADCKGPLNANLIACLQPDRRVDIEVIGSTKN